MSTQITFSLHGHSFVFDRKTLGDWMSKPLKANARIDIRDPEQAEAAFDLVCAKGDMPPKIISLLEQMDNKKFASCFTVTEIM